MSDQLLASIERLGDVAMSRIRAAERERDEARRVLHQAEARVTALEAECEQDQRLLAKLRALWDAKWDDVEQHPVVIALRAERDEARAACAVMRQVLGESEETHKPTFVQSDEDGPGHVIVPAGWLCNGCGQWSDTDEAGIEHDEPCPYMQALRALSSTGRRS